MNPAQYEAKRQFLASLYKQAVAQGNKGAANFLRAQLEALDVVKVVEK